MGKKIDMFEKYGPKIDDVFYEGFSPEQIVLIKLWHEDGPLTKRDKKALAKLVEKADNKEPTDWEKYEG